MHLDMRCKKHELLVHVLDHNIYFNRRHKTFFFSFSLTWHHIFMSYFTTVVLFVMLSAHYSRSEVCRALCVFVKCTLCAFTAE